MGNSSNLFVLRLIVASLLLTSAFATTTTAKRKPRRARSAPASTLQELIVPIHKDAATGLVVATFNAKTPLKPFNLVLDLTARSLWANCETGYTSNTQKFAKCGSAECKTANTSFCHTCGPSARAFCHANTCGLLLENPVTHQSTIGEVAHDVVALLSTDGSNPGPVANVPNFLMTCAPSDLVAYGLPKEAQGIAGLAQAPIAIQNQLAARLKIQPKFTMCLPSGNTYGPLFFGDGPFNLLPGIQGSTLMSYTPLTTSSFGEYFIPVKSIRINSKLVPVKPSMLSGGTMISTTEQYTVLKTPLYQAVISFYEKQFSGQPRIKYIAPFFLCYEKSTLKSTILGPGVPSIELEMEGTADNGKKSVVWSFFGANLMVEAYNGALCLAVVDGGDKYQASMVIGTYQMQDNFVQVDVGKSRVGFSGLLYGRRTNCANFNFTSAH